MSEFKHDPKARRYYWLKLKDNFFEQKEIKLLRKLTGGDTFTIIYLKMLLKSLRDDGRLYFEAIGENFAEELSLDLDEEVENVEVTLKYLQSKGLLESAESDEFFLNRISEMIGSESYSAERVRRYRERQKKGGQLPSNADMLPSNIEVTKRKEIEKRDKRKHICSNQQLSERFEQLWKAYPNKQGKKRAFASYKKAVKDGVTDEEIMTGIKRYQQQVATKEKQFIAHGSTWFFGRRWEDDYDTAQSATPDYSVPPENRLKLRADDLLVEDLPF